MSQLQLRLSNQEAGGESLARLWRLQPPGVLFCPGGRMGEKRCRSCGREAFRYVFANMDLLEFDRYSDSEILPGTPAALLCLGCLGRFSDRWVELVSEFEAYSDAHPVNTDE